MNLRVVVEGAIYVAGCSFVLWKGGWPERLVSAAMVMEFVISLAITEFQPPNVPHYLTVVLDFGVLGAVLYVAFATDLRWALLGAALQILSILTHVTRMIDPSIHSWAYVTVGITLGYALILTLIYGAIRQMMARREARRAAPR